MSTKSNDQGRAYEYICLITLQEEISKLRAVNVENNSSYFAAEKAWNCISNTMQGLLKTSAKVAIETLFELEPLILEDDKDTLNLLIQPDFKGESADVRDILIIRKNIKWEIGLSIKHNHLAVKHSRLAKTLDFGERWFGKKCSNDYWNDVHPIFEYLQGAKSQKMKWCDLPLKENAVYVPLLNAFCNEIKRSDAKYRNIPRKMVEYLLGEFDFYKLISLDGQKLTQIHTYNLHGTLNKPGKFQNSKISVPLVSLPTRIISVEKKPNSKNTVEIYFDNGWQFSFRIHNAATLVEPSLKFDVQIIGMPTTIMTINCLWK